MPPLVCPRCHRTNPADAVYCYFDGNVLRHVGGPGGLPPSQLLREFVFPSGRRCRNFDDLVQGCQYEWEDARDLLRRGDFARYLASVGRMDLAKAAQEGQNQPDPDIALHNFVSNLPATQVQGPRLDLNPRRLVLGSLWAGDQRQVKLTVLNQGKGLLQGKLTITEGGEWLKTTDGNGQCALKTAREQQITLRVDTRGLAAPHAYSAKLTVITNGGIVEVPVRLDLSSVPFPRVPFQGAGTPREMAERMRANPKPAVALLENGDVARWFAANGWAYPVQGPQARGVAAVQQFFEGMGLSRPPALQLSETALHFVCLPPEVVRGQVTLRTPAKKWVYAQVESDVAWLKIITPNVSGPQQAAVGFEIDSSLMDEGRVHEGTIRLTANAGQLLTVRVRVDVERPHEPFTRRLLRPFFAGALLALLFRLLLALPGDLYARVLTAGPGEAPAGTLARWEQSPLTEDGYLRHFVLATWWVGALAGVRFVWKHEGRWSDLLCGMIAGAGAGLAGAATLGCLVGAGDALPRAILGRLAGEANPSPWVATPLWLALTSVCWAVLGGGIGFLLFGIGQRGVRLLAAAGSPFAWFFRLCGLQRAAAFFALQ
jgi:hypothetical protein